MISKNDDTLKRSGIAGALGQAIRNARSRQDARPRHYLTLSRCAMACQFEVFLRPEDRAFIPAIHQAFEEVDRLERQLSVYRPNSEICRLNQNAAKSAVQVEPRLYELLRLSRDIGRETGGAFDLTIGALIRCWGFLERRGRVPPPDELEHARHCSGWDALEFDDSRRTIFFRRKGVELNAGSVGKGFAIDRGAAILRESGLRNFLIHAGHSSILAWGDSNRGPGWEVALRNPGDAASGGRELCLQDRGMSTSGTGEQFFPAGNRRLGHIIDPRTGCPASKHALVSAVAPNAALAEMLSTAFFVMDESEVRSYCKKNRHIGVILNGFLPDESRARVTALGVTLEGREEVSD